MNDTNNPVLAQNFGYEYDSIGNRTFGGTRSVASAYTANNLNQYTSVQSVVNYSHDPDGNLTNYGAFVYTWDAENRLISVEESRSGVPAAFMKRLTFQYDYMSRRISKKLYRRQGNDWASAPQTEIAYIYDGWNLICESVRETKSAGGGGGQGGGGGKGKGQGQQGQAGGGSVSISTNYYVWGLDLSGTLQGAGGIGGLLMILPSSEGSGVGASSGGVGGGSFFPCFDANGNVSQLINHSPSTIDHSISIAAHYEYSPFDETIVATGPMADDFPFRFSTKYLDKETGLYNYGYRYYSPGLGRWLSRDPIGERGEINLYGFVGNHGIGRVDLYGLRVCCGCCDSKMEDLKDDSTIAGYISDLEGKHMQGDNSKPKCVGSITCSSSISDAGEFSTSTGNITIGCDIGSTCGLGTSGVKETLLHELQHAFNWCEKKWTGCDGLLCDEFRSHYCSGNCTTTSSCRDQIKSRFRGSQPVIARALVTQIWTQKSLTVET